MCKLFLLEGLECCKDTRMKAYNIRLQKLTAELKSSDDVQYRH